MGGIGERKLTLIRLTDLILSLDFRCLARFIHNERDLHLRVKAHVGVADQMHHKGVFASLGRSLELSLQSLHVESGLSTLVVYWFVERRECEGRNGNLALLAIGEEYVPARGVVAGEVWCECEGWLHRLSFFCGLLALSSLLWSAQNGIQVAFIGIYVFQIKFVEWRDVAASGRDKSSLDHQRDERAGNDEFLASDFKESLLDLEAR